MTDTRVQELKARAAARIDSARQELCDLSDKIQAHPEVAYQETQAAAWIGDYMQTKGFAVERGTGGLPTAFTASVKAPKPGPVVALLAEYDALPGVGHGCGHNLLGMGTVGAGLGVAAVIGELAGTAQVLGTPAEEFTEGKSGKILMIEKDVFKNIDLALAYHPLTETAAAVTNLGVTILDVDFHGKPAHAAADPWNGLNALDAVMLTYSAVSALRQQVKPDARIHMMITRGGDAVNIIPQLASMRIMFRTHDARYLQDMQRRIEGCARGAAEATGTQADIKLVTNIQSNLHNPTLYELAKANCQSLGVELPLQQIGPASTDVGNVSRVIPTFMFMARTHVPTNWHSKAVADAAVNDMAHDGMIFAAKILAMTTIDILANPDVVTQAKQDFETLKNQ